jgi:hypothetical protein
MVACAKFLGRNVNSCTRGIDNCVCRKEDEMVTDAEFNNLINENKRLKDLLRQIGYPMRGTDEDLMDIYDAGKLIQSNFSLKQLED